MYVASDREYYLNSEDVRTVNMKHSEVALRRTARRIATNSKKTYEFDLDEIATLRLRCWRPLQDCINL